MARRLVTFDCLQSESSALLNSSEPGRSLRDTSYEPACGTTTWTAKDDEPNPLPPFLSEPSLGTPLKNTSPDPSTPTWSGSGVGML